MSGDESSPVNKNFVNSPDNTKLTLGQFMNNLLEKHTNCQFPPSPSFDNVSDGSTSKARKGRLPRAYTFSKVSTKNNNDLHSYFSKRPREVFGEVFTDSMSIKQKKVDCVDSAEGAALGESSSRSFLRFNSVPAVSFAESHTVPGNHLLLSASTTMSGEKSSVEVALEAIQQHLKLTDEKNEKMIGDLKSVLTTELDKIKEIGEAVNNRLSACESQTEEIRADLNHLRSNLSVEIGKALVENKSTIIDPVVNSALETASARIASLEASLQRLDQSNRKCNIILKGLPNGGSLEVVNKFLLEAFGIKDGAIDTFCINKSTGACRVKLRNMGVKSKVITLKREKLGQSQIYIDNDLTPMQAEIAKNLRGVKKQASSEGRVVSMRGDAICIDSKWYTWDLGSKTLVAKRGNVTNQGSHSGNASASNLAVNTANFPVLGNNILSALVPGNSGGLSVQRTGIGNIDNIVEQQMEVQSEPQPFLGNGTAASSY